MTLNIFKFISNILHIMPRKLSNSHKKNISNSLKKYHKTCKKSKNSFNEKQLNKEINKLKEMINKKPNKSKSNKSKKSNKSTTSSSSNNDLIDNFIKGIKTK